MINRNDLITNGVFFYICLITLLINNLLVNTLVGQVILLTLLYVLFLIYVKKKLKRFTYAFASPAFIFLSVYVPYCLVPMIMFILGNYSTKMTYFSVSTAGMIETSRIYIIIYIVLLMLVALFNLLKKYELKDEINKVSKKTNIFFSSLNVFDVIVLFFTIISVAKILSCGLSFFSYSTLQKRSVLHHSLKHYVNLLLLIYSLIIFLYYTQDRKYKSNIMYIRVVSIIIYWAIYLTCERRIFVTLLVAIIMIYFCKDKVLKLGKVFIIGCSICILLLSAAYRGNIKFGKYAIYDVMHQSLGEFIYTYYISVYYTDNIDNINTLNGESYIKNSFMSLFPSFIVNNKPQEFSTQFKRELNLNVAFSFNPIAEGILNFGKYVIYFEPLIIALIIYFANKLYKFNPMVPLLISSFALDFYRGQFSNFFFDIIYCIVFVFLIYKISYFKKGDI